MLKIGRAILVAMLLSGLGLRAAVGAPGDLVDRIAVVLGQDVITVREIEELEAYLRYRRDHAQAAVARQTEGRLMQEAYEEAVTRKLVLKRLRADPEFQLSRGRARQEVEQALAKEEARTLQAALAPYGLSVERYAELESLTVATQDYVRAKFRYAIVPTPTQIAQLVESNVELKRRMERLSEEGREDVRALIARQLEYQNFLEQYERFVERLRADAEIVRVHVPEAE